MSVELANAYWTSAGPVEVHFGREWSLFDFAERCAQAAEIGLRRAGPLARRHRAPARAALARGHEARARRQRPALLRARVLWDWFLDEGDEARKAADAQRRMLFEAAAALDAHHIKAGNIPGTPCEMPRLQEAYAELVRGRRGALLGARCSTSSCRSTST